MNGHIIFKCLLCWPKTTIYLKINIMQQITRTVTHTHSNFIIVPNRFNFLKIDNKGHLSVVDEDRNDNSTTVVKVVFSKDDVIRLKDIINQQLKDWN